MKIGEVLRVGVLAAVVGACNNSPEKTPIPNQLETQRSAFSFNYRFVIQRGSDILVCYSDENPLSDNRPWVAYIIEGFCPDGKINKVEFGSEETTIRDQRIQLDSPFELINQRELIRKGKDIPPPFFGQDLPPNK